MHPPSPSPTLSLKPRGCVINAQFPLSGSFPWVHTDPLHQVTPAEKHPTPPALTPTRSHMSTGRIAMEGDDPPGRTTPKGSRESTPVPDERPAKLVRATGELAKTVKLKKVNPPVTSAKTASPEDEFVDIMDDSDEPHISFEVEVSLPRPHVVVLKHKPAEGIKLLRQHGLYPYMAKRTGKDLYAFWLWRPDANFFPSILLLASDQTVNLRLAERDLIRHALGLVGLAVLESGDLSRRLSMMTTRDLISKGLTTMTPSSLSLLFPTPEDEAARLDLVRFINKIRTASPATHPILTVEVSYPYKRENGYATFTIVPILHTDKPAVMNMMYLMGLTQIRAINGPKYTDNKKYSSTTALPVPSASNRIPWQLSHKAMHSLNGNSSRELSALLASHNPDGPSWNPQDDQRAHQPAPAPQIIELEYDSSPDEASSDPDSDFVPPQASPKSVPHNKKARRPPQPPAERHKHEWQPNVQQTIAVRTENIRGTIVDDDFLDALIPLMKNDNCAVIALTEIGNSKEFSEKLKQRPDVTITWSCPSVREVAEHEMEDAADAAEDIQMPPRHAHLARLQHNQIAAQLEQAPQQLPIGHRGLMIITINHVIPVHECIERSINHILIRTRNAKSVLILICAVYAPSHSAEANNNFYIHTLSPLERAHKGSPMVTIGDMNALYSTNNDQSPIAPVEKTEFRQMCRDHNLRDMLRWFDPSTPFTFKSNNTQRRLDYILTNDSFRVRFSTLTTRALPFGQNRDHRPIEISIEYWSKSLPIPFTRPITDRSAWATRDAANLVKAIAAIPINATAHVKYELTANFLTTHVAHHTRDPTLQNHIEKSKELRTLETIARDLSKILRTLKRPNTRIPRNSPISHDTRLNKMDFTPAAQICRRLHHIHSLNSGWDIDFTVTEEKADRITLVQLTFNGVLSAISSQKRADKAARIQGYVAKIQQNYKAAPSKFWKSIRRTLESETKFLTRVYATDNQGLKYPSSDPTCVEKAVLDMYIPHCTSRGEHTKQAMQRILRSLPQHNEEELLGRDVLHTPFTEAEVKASLEATPLAKAPGPDTIHGELIRQATASSPQFITIITNAFNQSLIDGIPADMRVSISILLHKKDDECNVVNYRPIALTQTLYKIYATLLNKRLVTFLEANTPLLDDAQTGFRPSRGTSQKLLAFAAASQEAVRTGSELHMQSNDFHKCFDSIEHWYIKMCMEHIQIPPQFVNIIMDTLTNISTQFRLGARLTPQITVTRGVRQGDPLSATLCVIALDPLLRVVNGKCRARHPNEHYYGAHAYADDFDLIFPSAQEMREAFDDFKRVAAAASLQISPTKSSYAYSPATPTQNRLALSAPDPDTLIETPIPTKPPGIPFKVLGVWFSSDGSWTHQKKTTLNNLQHCLRKLKPRAITEVQYIETLNSMILAMITYPMCVVPYTDVELLALDKVIVDATKRKLRLQDNYHDDFLHLPVILGGAGLLSVVNLHDAHLLNAFYLALNGPPCPAQRGLRQFERDHAKHDNHIKIAADSPWTPVLRLLEKKGIQIHTTQHAPINPFAHIHLLVRSTAIRAELTKRGIHLTPTKYEEMHSLLFSPRSPYPALPLEDLRHNIANRIPADTVPTLEELHAFLVNIQPLQQFTNTEDKTSSHRLGVFPAVLRKAPTLKIDDKDYLAYFSDGSKRTTPDGTIAGWAFTPHLTEATHKLIKQKISPYKYPRKQVDGPQTSARAELLGILAIIKSAPLTEPTAIFTDFKQAVDTIPTWDTLPYSVKSRTIDRDVYQAISNTLHEERATAGFMGTELDLIIRHIYAHATDDTPVSEQRQANIDQQANNYTRVTYSAMQKGNKTADMLAQKTTKPNPETATSPRDVASNPPTFTDKYYLTELDRNEEHRDIIQTSRHKTIKKAATNKILSDHFKLNGAPKKGARNASLAKIQLPNIDSYLSTASRSSPNPIHQKAFATVYSLRQHAALTSKKGASKSQFLPADCPYKRYYQTLYPDAYCILCRNAVPSILTTEDTAHLLSCPNHPTKESIQTQLWEDIRRDTVTAIERTANPSLHDPTIAARLIFPFALASAQAQASHIPPEAFLNDSQSSQLHQLIRTEAALGDEGYIPKCLPAALCELGLSTREAKALAITIAYRIHVAIHTIFRDRTRYLHRTRQQRKAHRQHVFGRALRDRSQHASDDEEEVSHDPSENQLAQSDVPQSSPVLMDDG